jgi:hypothetical protein
MLDRDLLVRGARWKHKNLQFEVFVREAVDGRYRLGRVVPEELAFEHDPMPLPSYTEEELVSEFNPIVAVTRYTLIAGEDWI